MIETIIAMGLILFAGCWHGYNKGKKARNNPSSDYLVSSLFSDKTSEVKK